jgi:hypothetical protein
MGPSQAFRSSAYRSAPIERTRSERAGIEQPSNSAAQFVGAAVAAPTWGGTIVNCEMSLRVEEH